MTLTTLKIRHGGCDMQDKFEEWFYQTANEDRPVVWFDKLVSEYHSSVEGWIRHAYSEGYKQAMKDKENE